MATLTIQIEAPGWTVAQLQQAVHDLDEVDSGPGEGIAPNAVTAWDVIQYIALGELSLSTMQETATALLNFEPDSDDLHRALDGVIVNKMED